MTDELVLNLKGTGMNRSGVSGSNLNGVTLPPTPASSSSSTTSSAVFSAASFPPSDGKQVKAVKRKTKIPNKQKKHQQMHQELIELSSTGIQMLNHYLLQYQVQQNKSTRTTTLQDPTQVATFVRENITQLKERRQKLKQQVVAMQGQSAETTESQLRKTNQQLLQQIEQIHQFMLQVTQQEKQLPNLPESRASSIIPPWQRNSLVPAIDAKIPASSRSPSDEANGSNSSTIIAYYHLRLLHIHFFMQKCQLMLQLILRHTSATSHCYLR